MRTVFRAQVPQALPHPDLGHIEYIANEGEGLRTRWQRRPTQTR